MIRARQPHLALGVAVLSPRELQVIKCRSLGLPYKLISPQLGISIATAKQHAGRAFEKLGVSNSLEAVRMLFL